MVARSGYASFTGLRRRLRLQRAARQEHDRHSQAVGEMARYTGAVVAPYPSSPTTLTGVSRQIVRPPTVVTQISTL
jgi:hypothetical protein